MEHAIAAVDVQIGERANMTNSQGGDSEQLIPEFSLAKLCTSNTLDREQDISSRLVSFTKKYEQMSDDVRAASRVIEKSSLYAESLLRSATFLQFRRRLHNIQQSMNKIDCRIVVIQQKLNSIRKNLPARKHSLVETGPMQYRCVYPGGVRFRDYPSINAKIVNENAIVVHNQVVDIAERVFIASEQSVFLHCRGVGWLFENKKDIICFKRVLLPAVSPPSPVTEGDT